MIQAGEFRHQGHRMMMFESPAPSAG